VVEQIGSDVKAFKIGDRVAYVGTQTYADYTVANPEFTVRLPDVVSFQTGAGLLLQGLVIIYYKKDCHYAYKVCIYG
jgi:NADPH2:quinone reductase